MSVINKTTNYICECGSHIKNSAVNINQHKKTKLHKKYLENKSSKPEEIKITENKINLVHNKDMSEKVLTKNAERVRAYRQRKKQELGDEKYKEFMRVQKAQTRLATKVKKDIKKVEEGKEIKSSSKKENKEAVANYVAELLKDLDTQKKYDKPAIIQLVQQKIKKFDTTVGAETNCDQLIDNLDRTNLVNPSKYGDMKKKSLKDYMANIKLVYKYMFSKEFDCSNFNWTRDVDAVSKAIESMPNTRTGKDETTAQTKTKRYTSFKAILERLDGFHTEAKEYKKLQDDSQKIVDKKRSSNQLSDREKANWIEWDKLVKYEDKSWTDEDRLIHALYTCMPPRRLEYGNLYLARHKSPEEAKRMDTSLNYIVSNNKNSATCIILNDYKTANRYHQFFIDLTKPDSTYFKYSKIRNFATTLIRKEQIIHKDPIFPNTKGVVYPNFGERLKYVFRNTKKNISCDILRHSFITNYLGKHTFLTLDDDALNILSKAMGHSPGMFINYRKFGSNEKILEKFIEEDEKD